MAGLSSKGEGGGGIGSSQGAGGRTSPSPLSLNSMQLAIITLKVPGRPPV